MTHILKRAVVGACVLVAALAIPTPAMAADTSRAASDATAAQPAVICEIVPIFWWCKK